MNRILHVIGGLLLMARLVATIAFCLFMAIVSATVALTYLPAPLTAIAETHNLVWGLSLISWGVVFIPIFKLTGEKEIDNDQ